MDSPLHQCLCQVGDRVLFHSKKGIPHYGSVQWTGKKEKVPYNLVGIKTVSIIKHSIELHPLSLVAANSLILYFFKA